MSDPDDHVCCGCHQAEEYAAFEKKLVEAGELHLADETTIFQLERKNASLRAVLDRCHEAVGEDPASDDETLPEGISERLATLRAEVERLTRCIRELERIIDDQRTRLESERDAAFQRGQEEMRERCFKVPSKNISMAGGSTGDAYGTAFLIEKAIRALPLKPTPKEPGK